MQILKLAFLNRERELDRINRALTKSEPVFIVLYGRRRIGKSRLLQRIIGKNDIYFLADQRNTSLQIASLSKEISRVIPGFSDAHFSSWDTILSTFNARVPDRLTLVFDEFPYLAQMAPELPSILQNFIDNKGKINIIICGSSQRMMQGLVLDSTAPLYGRADEIIQLTPLKPGLIAQVLNCSEKESIAAYAAWGGVPRYWELAKGFKSHKKALKELVFDRNGVLYDEPSRLLSDDMKSIVQANSLLSLIANGCHKISEIASRIQIPSTSLTRPLSNLIELGYIKRELPFGETIKSTKRTLYKLNDPFLSFWYKFILPNKSLLERDLINEVFVECEKKFSLHQSLIWEELARESTSYLKIEKISWKPAQRWWGTGKDGRKMEIDVLAESFDKTALLFGEVKWSEKISSTAEFKKLDYTITNFTNRQNKRIVKAVWTKKKMKSTGDVTILGPEDVLSVMV